MNDPALFFFGLIVGYAIHSLVAWSKKVWS